MNKLEKQILRLYPLTECVGRLAKAVNERSRRANICMFHTGRCGSTVLGNLIGQIDSLQWSGEIFEAMHRKYGKSEYYMSHPFKILELRMNLCRASYFGFETKALPENHLRSEWLDMELADYVDALVARDYSHFIILQRKNYLKRLVSALVGRRRGTFITRKEMKRVEPVEINLKNVAERKKAEFQYTLPQYFEEMERHYKDLGHLLENHSPLHLTYEDDIKSDPLIGYRKVCDYIGVDAQPVHVEIKKTTAFPLEMVISNYDAVRSVVQGTEHEWMLNDQ